MAESNGTNVGRVEQVTGVVVDAVFPDQLPEIYSAVKIEMAGDGDGEPTELVCEVQQHLGDDRVRAVAMDATDGLSAATASSTPAARSRFRSATSTLGRIFNLLGEPIDEGAELEAEERWPIHRPAPERLRPDPDPGDPRDRDQGHRPARPLRERRQGRAVRRRRRRQDRADPGADPQHRRGARGPLRLLRRRRALARGQRPLARDERVGRDRQDDARLRPDERAPGRPPPRRPLRPDDGRVLPRAGRPGRAARSSTTSSASSRRAPRSRPCSAGCPRRSATSRRWRPRWAACRSGSPRPSAARSPRSRRSTSRPTTTPTRRRPRSSPTSTRPRRSRGRSPRKASTRRSTRSTRPRRSSSPTSSARSTTAPRPRSRRFCSATRSCRTSSPSSASTSSPTRTSQTVSRARKIERFLSQPFFVAEQFTGRTGEYVPVAETVRGFREILDGEHDDLPEGAFYMQGSIDQVTENAKAGAAA